MGGSNTQRHTHKMSVQPTMLMVLELVLQKEVTSDRFNNLLGERASNSCGAVHILLTLGGGSAVLTGNKGLVGGCKQVSVDEEEELGVVDHGVDILGVSFREPPEGVGGGEGVEGHTDDTRCNRVGLCKYMRCR